MAMSPDRAHRIWRGAGLQVPRRRPRRRIASHRPRPLPANGANQVWAYDFVHDACANGQKPKCLTSIDEYTRECLAIDTAGRTSPSTGRSATSVPGLTVVRAEVLQRTVYADDLRQYLDHARRPDANGSRTARRRRSWSKPGGDSTTGIGRIRASGISRRRSSDPGHSHFLESTGPKKAGKSKPSFKRLTPSADSAAPTRSRPRCCFSPRPRRLK